jgi:hypothetical protein
MRLLLLSLLAGSALALPVAAQVHRYPVPAFMQPQHYQLPKADCAIFPAAAALDVAALGSPGRFTPTTQQVDSVEYALATVDLNRVNAEPELPGYEAYPQLIKKKLPQYRRQYFGFYNSLNHSCLHITFIKADLADAFWLQWREKVFDAGPDYWTVCYDASAKVFYTFEHGGN